MIPAVEAAMRRIGLVLLLVLSASLLLVSPTVNAAQTTPTGEPASSEVQESVNKFFTIFVNRINRHDKRALDQIDSSSMFYLFANSNDTALDGLISPAKIEVIDDIRVLPDGTISAVLSISGIPNERGYYTYDVVLTQAGESFRITDLRPHDGMVFPEGAKVAEIAATNKPDGTVDIVPASVPPSDYLLIKIDNQGANTILIMLTQQIPTYNVIANTSVGGASTIDGHSATVATLELEPGQYTLETEDPSGMSDYAVLTIKES